MMYSPFASSSPFSTSPLPVPVVHSRSAPVLPSYFGSPPPTPTPTPPPHRKLESSIFPFEEEPPPSPTPLFSSSSQEESRSHPSEQPSRTLFVRNVSTMSDKDLRTIFSEFGAVQTIYTASKNRGFVMVTFFDQRDTDSAKASLNGKPLGDKDSNAKDPQPGFVLLQTSADVEEVRLIASRYGDIKDISNKIKGCKIVEFFDTRAAETLLSHRVEIGGQIVIPKTVSRKNSNTAPQPVLIMLQTSADVEDVRVVASRYGEVKEITAMKGCKIVEFQDSRCAEVALNHRWEIAGQIVVPKPVSRQSSPHTPPRQARRTPQRPRSQSAEPSHGGTSLWHSESRELARDPRAPRPSPAPEQFLFDPQRVLSGEDKRTTLMIRNIPNKYTQKMLLTTFEEQHRGCFDFIYLPIDFQNWCNVGYAFINFVKPEEIVRFYENFHGKRWKHYNSEKICEISYGRIQGKESLIDHFQSSNLMGEDKRCRPMVFEDGNPVHFPPRKAK